MLMFGSVKYGANAYAKVGVETGVVAASPHKLIVMLYDGALVAILSAMNHMKSGNIPEKGKYISKAILIIDSGLRASLNKDAGGEIALNLDSLYDYMSNRLLQANLTNQPELLEEVYGLLLDLKSAWDAIVETSNTMATEASPPPPALSAYDSLKPRTSSLARA
jgi:flagellar secretion chaperone FliS